MAMETPMYQVPVAGVTLAWLLLSVQLALLPLLHALHGHSLTDHHLALGRDRWYGGDNLGMVGRKDRRT